jgi:hypothetical protein
MCPNDTTKMKVSFIVWLMLVGGADELDINTVCDCHGHFHNTTGPITCQQIAVGMSGRW